ncbi:pleckstrin homology domain-containing family G member 3 isoform X1 [Clarias gariepinus]|uniref:pleckstrin homology domain-containing family G member 3 isoform X1 n=1 Tax=Clarias gariepinus TaxID=13013 RepID=UPI00234DF819|nr:pleckstrin homology domain-containing family G member 3 isoform X1 [Clarias gariepinus]XP_053344746.1 pleckstrin homology domain-containing family G member 3 isoform X1 [Clarias gariepinus]XP_053344747.1 pleckstrin homology domain-containing family G member 3 isoform X1 [Clarias gariepinus]
MAPNPELSYLDRVVLEIIETERMYVRDLHSIVEGYLTHIIDAAGLPIVPEQVCALFGNIEDIYEFNSELLQDLDLCKNHPVSIARCFVLKSDYFDIYTQYCTNYPNSVAALTECMRNKTLLKFFMERQEALQHPLPLGSYLLKPVQRILKYHLLLQEIAKHFDPDEEGYDVVEEAINTMTEVAWYINTMKRKHEHAVRLQEVQSLLINWRGPDLTTYGELVLEGTFRFHHTKNNRTLFLFERVLLITKRRGENFVYKTHISCSTLMLMEGVKDSPCFSVTHYKHPKHPHTVQARTLEEKKLWTHHIKRLILENHHTTIPQKAKEVILEMDPMYEKYRFNSDRKKKTQSDDFTHARQSELNKQMLRNNNAVLKDEECQRPGDADLSQQEERRVCEDPNTNKASPKILQFLKSSAVRGSETGLQSTTDVGGADGDRVSAVEGSDQYSVKEELMLNQEGQSSEEEVEEESTEPENHSILPSSVLDKAGLIAEHFIASTRRSTLAPDELRSPQHTYQEGTSSKNTTANFTLMSPKEDTVSGPDRHFCKRRDSILSKQEQLLIDKVRSYYESAEQQDAGFSLKRRESLAYIPSGLVRSSVSHFNKFPRTDHWIKAPNMDTPLMTSSLASSDINTKPDEVTWHGTDGDVSVSHKPEEISDGCFRSSAEMIKVWEEMEKEVTRSQRDNKFRDASRFRGTTSVSQRFSRKTEHQEREPTAADDLGTITEESPAKSKEETESGENAVFSLTKKFNQHKESEVTFTASRRRGSDTTTTAANNINLPLSTGEETKRTRAGKPNLVLSLTACVQTTQDATHTPSSNSGTVLSPERSHLKSPLHSEGFPWPDVSKLRSRYHALDGASQTQPTPAAHTLSPELDADNRASRVRRAGSLDQKLPVFAWTDLQSKKVTSDYSVSAQAALPNNRTVIVLEKVTTHTSRSPSHGQVQSSTSLEKTSPVSVTERCRLYEDLDEAVLRAGPDTKNKDSNTDKYSNGTQPSVVKNLREKFLSLS